MTSNCDDFKLETKDCNGEWLGIYVSKLSSGRSVVLFEPMWGDSVCVPLDDLKELAHWILDNA